MNERIVVNPLFVSHSLLFIVCNKCHLTFIVIRRYGRCCHGFYVVTYTPVRKLYIDTHLQYLYTRR